MVNRQHPGAVARFSLFAIYVNRQADGATEAALLWRPPLIPASLQTLACAALSLYGEPIPRFALGISARTTALSSVDGLTIAGKIPACRIPEGRFRLI